MTHWVEEKRESHFSSSLKRIFNCYVSGEFRHSETQNTQVFLRKSLKLSLKFLGLHHYCINKASRSSVSFFNIEVFYL